MKPRCGDRRTRWRKKSISEEVETAGSPLGGGVRESLVPVCVCVRRSIISRCCPGVRHPHYWQRTPASSAGARPLSAQHNRISGQFVTALLLHRPLSSLSPHNPADRVSRRLPLRSPSPSLFLSVRGGSCGPGVVTLSGS